MSTKQMVRVGGIEYDPTKTTADFVALLHRCLAQVEADPEGYSENLHLYSLQFNIFRRLCHGNITELAVS